MRKSGISMIATAVAIMAATSPATAQAWPTRPLTMVVPFAAGGSSDVIARIVAQKLSEGLGGQFYVEDLPGAGGTIGAGTAANAPADGYTILLANQDLVIQQFVKAKVPYDPFKSFTPVSNIVAAPEMIVVLEAYAPVSKGVKSVSDE